MSTCRRLLTVKPGATMKMCFEKRSSCGYVTLFNTCHATTIAITTVLPLRAAIGRDGDAYPLRCRGFSKPDQGLDCFKLAKEKPLPFVTLRAAPVFQQP